MPKRGILFAIFVLLAGIGTVAAEETPRLTIERLGDLQTGTYTTTTGLSFSLDHYNDKYLMRFSGEPEIYVLYVDHGSLGGSVLKFDSGGVALQVSGWGAVTIYTDSNPNGLPAERTANSTPPTLASLSLAQMQAAATDEAEHLAYQRGLHIAFTADWGAIAADAALRALTFDAMQNAARGIDRFAASNAARGALRAKIDTVHLTTGGRATISLIGKTLQVTFVPAQGFAGRASSHGIARALGILFAIPTPN